MAAWMSPPDGISTPEQLVGVGGDEGVGVDDEVGSGDGVGESDGVGVDDGVGESVGVGEPVGEASGVGVDDGIGTGGGAIDKRGGPFPWRLEKLSHEPERLLMKNEWVPLPLTNRLTSIFTQRFA